MTTQQPISTIANILSKHSQDTKQTRFTCKAEITNIADDRNWYYVNCPHCSNKLYLQDTSLDCEDHGTIPEPTFMYFVNTTISDGPTNAKAIFFNEAMTEMLSITCRDRVVLHGYMDPPINHTT